MKENQHDPEREMWPVKGKQYIGQSTVKNIMGFFSPHRNWKPFFHQENLADPQIAKNKKKKNFKILFSSFKLLIIIILKQCDRWVTKATLMSSSSLANYTVPL